MAEKVTALDFDGDEIPEKYNNENYEEERDSMSHRIIKKTTGEQVAMKCPYTKKWCPGKMDEVFSCAGCVYYDTWLATKPEEDNNAFVKADNGKLQWSLIPFEQLEDVVRVLMNGAKKYARDNWKKCDDLNRYKDSLMRHVTAYIKGQKFDSGPDGDNLHHLAHAVCNCLFILYFDKTEIEDYKKWMEVKEQTLMERFENLKNGRK